MAAALLWMWLLFLSFMDLTGFVKSENTISINGTLGKPVILPCQDSSTKPIFIVEWSRTVKEVEYVIVYRDDQLDLEGQHPSFKDRVDLQDSQMKNGNVSLILNNVKTEDRGTYECRVIHGDGKRRKRSYDPISTIRLEVVSPAGPEERRGEKEGGEGGNSRGQHGLIVPVVGIIMTVAVVTAAAGLISQRHKKKKSDSPPDEAAVQQLV